MIFFYQFLSDRLEKREWRRKKAHIPKRKELILKKKKVCDLDVQFQVSLLQKLSGTLEY